MASNLDGDGYRYDALFYEYPREGSARSARALLPRVIDTLGAGSVLDVGCRASARLAAYDGLGISDHVGIDGDYVDRSMLVIAAGSFQPRNIAAPFDLGRQFDLVQRLKVGEHAPTAASTTLVDNIVRHGRLAVCPVSHRLRKTVMRSLPPRTVHMPAVRTHNPVVRFLHRG